MHTDVFFAAVFIMFLVLKLTKTKTVDWSWWLLVTAPLWIPIVAILLA